MRDAGGIAVGTSYVKGLSEAIAISGTGGGTAPTASPNMSSLKSLVVLVH
jgi:hypothetical protein